MRHLAVGFLLATTRLAVAQPTPTEEAKPWRIDRAIDAPAWLRLGLEHQSRFEHLSHDFRGKATDDATAFSMRTLVTAEASLESVLAGIELEDSRIYASDATALNTTLSDPLEILQAYVGVRRKNLVLDNDAFEARVGRLTIDLSTRRVVARNRFRNTINGFTGVDAKWTSPSKHVARAFVAVPVTRLPADAEALKDNSIDLDEESTDALLWCGYYGSPKLALGSQAELYVVGFHERDGDLASRNRQLLTIGARWYRKPARGTVDFDVELIPQLGRSRATAGMDDTTNLDHRALSTHVELAISPAMPWQPRLAMLHDYASGDRDPADGSTERFDPLFGARRFDFGPTGIYGPFNRSNVQSPGVRASIAPSPTFDASVGYRLFWLAARSDAWVAASVRDPMGDSGSFVGEHVEVQLRWSPLPKNLAIEGGAAYLRRGRFARSAPETREANPAYVYTQLTVTL
ncbi:MAG: alginate export family protein [Deltaproteobacteria bacterium]|nr:alginate export family protein [Deltaproteobacteria bacterium]